MNVNRSAALLAEAREREDYDLDTLIKSLLYIGTVMALGAGIFAWFVGPELMQGAVRRRTRLGLYTGAAIVILGSPLHVVATVTDLLGYFDPVFGREYLLATRHGTATLFRLGAVALVVAATILPLGRTAGRLFFGTASLLLLGSFSWTSHAVAVGGLLPLLADLLHYAAAALWAGAVIYAAWLPLWQRPKADPQLVAVVDRVSTIGLACVGLLLATGIYTALLHVRTPEILTSSPYGRVLTIKNLLVVLIIGIAAVHRWWFLPAVRLGNRLHGFTRLFRAEALLLLAVLAVTGLLTTSALPHDPGVQPDPIDSLRNFLDWIRR